MTTQELSIDTIKAAYAPDRHLPALTVEVGRQAFRLLNETGHVMVGGITLNGQEETVGGALKLGELDHILGGEASDAFAGPFQRIHGDEAVYVPNGVAVWHPATE